MTALPPQTKLKNGQYTILDQAGEPGGFGITYRARWQGMTLEVAIKELFLADGNLCTRMPGSREVVTSREKGGEFREYSDKFKEEALRLFSLHDANVVGVHDYFEENNTAYIVMEYLPGSSLADLVYRQRKFSEQEAYKIIEPVCQCVSRLHEKNILHRDISPENILFRDEATPVLIDFGLAREHISRRTKTSAAWRSGYSPLEAYSVKGARGVQSDVYSLGGVLYFMVTGEDPPDAPDLAHGTEELRFPEELSSTWRQAIIKAMQLKIPERYASAKELLEGLTRQGRTESTAPLGKVWVERYTGMEFVWVPGGSFQMGDIWGDGDLNEKPVHEVTVQGFYLGKYPVTQGEYEKVMGRNPSHFFKEGSKYPVEYISWHDAQNFIKKLNARTGKKFRLPSEAQWEYAARGGRDDKWSGTSWEFELSNYAWYSQSIWGPTSKVYRRMVNGFDLCDMSGNVCEWCGDRWHVTYVGASRDCSTWIEGYSPYRVFRGGFYGAEAIHIRAAARYGESPGYKCDGLGFRLALPVQRQ